MSKTPLTGSTEDTDNVVVNDLCLDLATLGGTQLLGQVIYRGNLCHHAGVGPCCRQGHNESDRERHHGIEYRIVSDMPP